MSFLSAGDNSDGPKRAHTFRRGSKDPRQPHHALVLGSERVHYESWDTHPSSRAYV